MTPQYILRRSLCRPAHCYHAHVPGQGYVNDGTIVATRADYDRQRAQTAEQEICNLDWAVGYAEPGYEQPTRGVLLANWNIFPRGIDTLLERAGYAIEWSDEWATCEDCQKVFRTSPDGYGWTQAGVITEHGTQCTACHDDVPAEGTDHIFQVVVGNIGTVYTGPDGEEAHRLFDTYVAQSQSHVGRAGDEDVTVLKGDDTFCEYVTGTATVPVWPDAS